MTWRPGKPPRARATIPRCPVCNRRIGSYEGFILGHRTKTGARCPGSGQKPA